MSVDTAIPKTLMVILALHDLGGESDLEHIAVRAHEMFPQQFSWRSFPDLPDKDAVRVHLSEAKKATFGVLVTDKDLRRERPGDGVYTKRFALTAAGMKRAQELLPLLQSGYTVTATKNSIEYRRIIKPILDSDAYAEFGNGATITAIGRDRFLLAFKLFADAAPFVITGRLTKTEAIVNSLPDSSEQRQLKHFIGEGRNAFSL